MSEYAVDEQGTGLEGYDGGEYTGDEAGYEGTGYEDFGPVADTGIQDEFADVRETLEAYGIDPERFDEYVQANTGAVIAPVAEGVDAWQSQQAIEQTTGQLLDWMGGEFEKSGVPEDRFDEGAEAVLELAAGLFEQELERVGSERGQHERDQLVADYSQQLAAAGYTKLQPEDAAALSAEIDGLAEQRIAALAATDATVRALGQWVRSLDPEAGLRNYSVAKRMAEQGPLPSTRQAFREAGWTAAQIQPRSPSEAVSMHDYRKGGTVTARAFEGVQ
jgi:hypothetical protein